MGLSRSGHWAKGDRHAPVRVGNPIPRPLTKTLGRIIPLVMSKVKIGKAIYCIQIVRLGHAQLFAIGLLTIQLLVVCTIFANGTRETLNACGSLVSDIMVEPESFRHLGG